LSTLFPGVIGLYGVYQGIQQALLPAQVASIDPTNKVAVVALTALVSSVAGTVALPLGGALSDRTRGRLGRRTPWLLVSAVLTAVACVLMARATTVPLLAVSIGFVWFFANIYQSTIYAVIPDRVPVRLRGTASSVVGLGLPLGILASVNVVTRTGQFWGYAVLGIFLVLATVVFVVVAPEAPVRAPELRTSEPRRSVPARIAGFFTGFLTGFRHRDFTLVFLSRLFFFLGFFAVIDYVFYIVSDYVGPENTPFSGVNDAVAAVASINTISQVVAIVAFGWLADRLDRRKVVVALSAVAMAAAFVSPIIARDWAGLLVYAVLGGAATGVYFAVDIAIMSLVLPSRADEGRDLALLALATSVPAATAPLVAAGVFGLTGSYTWVLVLGAAAAAVGAAFMFGVRSVK
jgi:MFS family permease